MTSDPPPLGVSASSPPPASGPGPFVPLPDAAPAEPAAWTAAAQYTLAILIVLFLALLGWHGYGRSTFATRPAELHRGAGLAVVDLNRAAPRDLALLPGVGEALARAIVREREANGPFRAVDDLRRVPGLGPATLERLRPFACVEEITAAPRPRVVRGAAPRDEDEPPATRKPTPAELIDLNAASEAELRQLPGVGPTLAARIVAARREKRFASLDDLRRVKGIGAKTLEKIRPHARVAAAEAP